ncbi:type II toxin-antitoxin system RelE/ParE family toxin [Nostoc sp. DedSLP04]|uniref:type II toxin-antitoxin system RelE family toxin n=1 Tax=Nostoc sp. DedSLP04 TaxID=3075401 RepID=UPI002AD2EABA|nr:type II toxin-antitoxin system RelE/ParE family toxin [Nostoc sp. DedSLP04]MDZ8030480.1 type II toxin-antitoxin system RelE/ParE family toxin [Nostoc sp. DedSLP04]
MPPRKKQIQSPGTKLKENSTCPDQNEAIYKIEFKNSARKQFLKLPPEIQIQINPIITNLAFDPRPSGVKKLKGSTDQYRIRSGDYRVLYKIQDSILLILVLAVGDRKEIYKDM